MPNNRGFDTSVGWWSGGDVHYTTKEVSTLGFLDLRYNLSANRAGHEEENLQTFSTYLWGDAVDEVRLNDVEPASHHDVDPSP